MKIAVYAGTFDPITLGHVDILARASHLFDKLILAIAEDNYKDTFFTPEERVDIAKKAVAELPNVEVKLFKAPEIDSLFLMTAPEYQFVSSSIVKNFTLLGYAPDSIVSPCVAAALQEKLAARAAVNSQENK